MRRLFALILIVAYGPCIAQHNDSVELYLQKIANVESLMVLKKFKEARMLFSTISNQSGKLEYDYLKSSLSQQEKSLKILEGSIMSMAFSQPGEMLAIGCSDSTIYLRSVSDLKPKSKLRGHSDAITCLDFSSNGKWLVSGSRDKSVIVWDVSSGQVVKKLHEDSWRGIYDVDFSPDASLLGVTTWTFVNDKVEGIVHLFDTQSWQLIDRLESPSPHPVSTFEFTRDGRGAVYGTWGLTMHYYDFVQRNVRWMLNLMDNPEYSSMTSLDVSPDNESIVLGTKDTKVRLINRKSGEIYFESAPYQWHNDEVNDVAFSPSGDQFASSSIDQSINIGDSQSGKLLSTLLGHEASVNDIVFDESSKKLYSGSADGFLNVWDLDHKQLEMYEGCPDPGYGRGLFFTVVDKQGKRAAMACGDNILIRDIDHKTLTKINVPTYYGLDFMGDDQLVIGGREGKVSVWQISTQQKLQEFEAHEDYIQRIVSVGGDRILTCSGKLMKLWDLNRGRALKTYEAESFIQSIKLLTKQNLVIATLSSGNVMLMDFKNLTINNEWNETATASRIAVSQNETRFALGMTDGSIIVYDSKSFQRVASFKETEGSIYALSFDQSGNYVISSTSRNTQTVRFWSIDSQASTLSLHGFPDISFIRQAGSQRRLMLADKHGRVFLLRY